MRSKKSSIALFLSGAVLFSNTVLAEANLEEVNVTAHPLASDGFAQPVTVLSGEELAEKIQGSLGETVSNQPGIRSASFGSAVGRPVIHGLGGARVKTTEDRIDSLDVSVTSADHAVTIEPFIANKITILKGASTLLYGSGAIGGVVDVETGRIPQKMPEKTITGRAELRAADNANAKTGALRLDGALSDNIAWHFDGFTRDADDYEIPGFVESQAFRAAEEAEEAEEGHAHEGEEEAEARDVLVGSRLKNKGGAVGFSWIGERGFAGVSISKLDAEYGLVGGHEHEEEGEEEHDHEGEEDHDHEEEEAPGKVDLEQTRIDFEAQLNDPFAGFEKINFRFGINDYQHKEIEGNGEVGTVFDNEAWEGRVELSHKAIAGFTGAMGTQLSHRKFSALGEEAFVKPVETDSQGLFWVLQRDFDVFSIETGVRVDKLKHKPLTSNAKSADFSTGSASLGVLIPLSEELSISGLIDYSSRAPSVEELYSNGAHLATQSFELGDVNLNKESAVGFTFTLNYESDLFDAGVTVYRNEFDDFIYQANTGLTEDDLPLFKYQQKDASFTGLDAKVGIHLFEVNESDLDLTLLFDTVKAELDIAGNDNLPRIPATRVGAGLEWDNTVWTAKLNYAHVSEQDEVSNFELPSDAYDDVSIYLAHQLILAGNEFKVFLHGRNLTDDEQRHHTSFVKDLAPAAGRRLEVGLRYQF